MAEDYKATEELDRFVREFYNSEKYDYLMKTETQVDFEQILSFEF